MINLSVLVHCLQAGSVIRISDALQAVKDGRLSASVLQDANGQASAVIDVAVKVGVGEEVESRYNVPFQLITADNVDDYLE